ncbi:MAG: bifunctional 5,10-methylenetetrahydrofolate dehydrogenase/5,10-methenyltetrahydrofolate cyclohydrolase [bacterium]
MKIINGKKIADRILADLKEKIKEEKTEPCLAIILVGKNPVSRLYVSIKEKASKKIGIRIKKYILLSSSSEKSVLETINLLNNDSRVDGILVQMPLPKHISPDRVIQKINPKKDVDGFLLKSEFDPPFILAIWQSLKATRKILKDKKIIALVNSDIFGQRLSRFLKTKGLIVEYLKVKKDLRGDIISKIKLTDVLITVCGRPNLIKGLMIKSKAILIDGGITKKNNQVIGDIDANDVKNKAGWLAPAPGGVGPITVALLLKNVLVSSQKARF